MYPLLVVYFSYNFQSINSFGCWAVLFSLRAQAHRSYLGHYKYYSIRKEIIVYSASIFEIFSYRFAPKFTKINWKRRYFEVNKCFFCINSHDINNFLRIRQDYIMLIFIIVKYTLQLRFLWKNERSVVLSCWVSFG